MKHIWLVEMETKDKGWEPFTIIFPFEESEVAETKGNELVKSLKNSYPRHNFRLKKYVPKED